jgi:hypothetical protein
MRFLMLTLLGLILTADSLSGQAGTGGSASIFRYITIAPYGEIRLGEPFQQASALGAPIKPRLFRLLGPNGRPVQFADTQAILVELGSGDLVRALFFLYSPGSDSLGARERDYRESLGEPRRSSYDSAGARIDARIWEDGNTRFELMQVTDTNGKRILSALRDLQPARPRAPRS